MAEDSLVLDIGGDIGALVIHADADRAEIEIEISPGTADPGPRTHNVVHARHTRHGGTTYSAVFPQLASGDYTIWCDETTPHGTVTVHGGQVIEYRLS